MNTNFVGRTIPKFPKEINDKMRQQIIADKNKMNLSSAEDLDQFVEKVISGGVGKSFNSEAFVSNSDKRPDIDDLVRNTLKNMGMNKSDSVSNATSTGNDLRGNDIDNFVVKTLDSLNMLEKQ